MFKKYKIYLFLLILIILGFVFYNNRVVIKEYFAEPEKIELPEALKFEEIVEPEEEEINEVIIPEEPEVVPELEKEEEIVKPVISEINPSPNLKFGDGINLDVPFTIQSPEQKWNDPYDEACEEASILMVQAFLNDEEITTKSALKDIMDMVDWQMENYEGHFDLSVNSTARIAQEFLNLEARVINLNSVEDIKDILKSGYPVIIPSAGRELGNPNFKGEGPLYHMLVVKGFTRNGLIVTNDPGTRKGENYVYDAEVLWNAIADWDYDLQSPNQDKKLGILLRKNLSQK